jgi:hypothetical protein
MCPTETQKTGWRKEDWCNCFEKKDRMNQKSTITSAEVPSAATTITQSTRNNTSADEVLQDLRAHFQLLD